MIGEKKSEKFRKKVAKGLEWYVIVLIVYAVMTLISGIVDIVKSTIAGN